MRSSVCVKVVPTYVCGQTKNKNWQDYLDQFYDSTILPITHNASFLPPSQLQRQRWCWSHPWALMSRTSTPKWEAAILGWFLWGGASFSYKGLGRDILPVTGMGVRVCLMSSFSTEIELFDFIGKGWAKKSAIRSGGGFSGSSSSRFL